MGIVKNVGVHGKFIVFKLLHRQELVEKSAERWNIAMYKR